MNLLLKRAPALAGERRRVVAVIAGGWLLASLVLVAVAPGGESHDAFDYLFRGRMLVEAGGSPLANTPNQYAELPFYRYITWTDHVDTYGPLWEYASGAVAAATRGALQAVGRWDAGAAQCPEGNGSCFVLLIYVLAYRVLAVVLAGLCGWLIYSLVRRENPQLAVVALLAWLWNPLLLVSSAVGAHNDMVMLVLILASFWALQRRRVAGGAAAAGAGGACEADRADAGAAVWAVAGATAWLATGVGLRRVDGCMVGLAISWLLYAPLGGWATLPRMLEERQRFVALSFHHVVYRLLLEHGVDGPLIWRITIRWPTVIYAIGSIVITAVMVGWRRADASAARWRRHARLLAGSGGSQPLLSAGRELLVSGVVRALGAGAGVAATRQPFHAATCCRGCVWVRCAAMSSATTCHTCRNYRLRTRGASRWRWQLYGCRRWWPHCLS